MKKYSVSEIHKHTSLLSDQDIMPFQITHTGKVVAEVIQPGTKWPACEVCGEITPNVKQFKHPKTKEWMKLVLCDRCSADHL